MAKNTETVRSGYTAFGRGDIPGVLAVLDPAICWTVPPDDTGWGGDFDGTDAVLGFFGQLPGRYGNWSVSPLEFLEIDDRVVVLGEHRFPDGDAIPFAHVWTMTNGKAARFIEYVDNTALHRHVLATA